MKSQRRKRLDVAATPVIFRMHFARVNLRAVILRKGRSTRLTQHAGLIDRLGCIERRKRPAENVMPVHDRGVEHAVFKMAGNRPLASAARRTSTGCTLPTPERISHAIHSRCIWNPESLSGSDAERLQVVATIHEPPMPDVRHPRLIQYLATVSGLARAGSPRPPRGGPRPPAGLG